jgi:hypothetical protein
VVIAEEFVFLHAPKMGGTFVTEVLQDIYAGQCSKTLIVQDKHGGADRIPAAHRSKPRVATVRNPFDYYASLYQFGWWINRDLQFGESLWDAEKMRRRFVRYPDLTFDEFIEGMLEIGYRGLRDDPALADRLRLGPQTVSVLRSSVPNFIELLERFLVHRDLAELTCRVAETRFLQTEALNRQTHRWLLDLGVAPGIARPVLFKSKVQPLNTPDGQVLDNNHGQPRHIHWSALFTERTRAAVLEREWLLLKLFPEYAWFL